MDLDLTISVNQTVHINLSVQDIIKTSFNETSNQYSINDINKFVTIFDSTYLINFDDNTHYFIILNIYFSSQQQYELSLLTYQSISNNKNKLNNFIQIFENNIQHILSIKNNIIINRLKMFNINNNNHNIKHILIEYSSISPTISPSVQSSTVSENTLAENNKTFFNKQYILIYISSIIIIFICGCFCALILFYLIQKILHQSERQEMDINQKVSIEFEMNKNMKTQTNKNINIYQPQPTKNKFIKTTSIANNNNKQIKNMKTQTNKNINIYQPQPTKNKFIKTTSIANNNNKQIKNMKTQT
eukprot:203566_1